MSIYEEGELPPGATIRKFRIVQLEGKRSVSRLVDHILNIVFNFLCGGLTLHPFAGTSRPLRLKKENRIALLSNLSYFSIFAIALFLIIWHTLVVRADFARAQSTEVTVSLPKRPVPTLLPRKNVGWLAKKQCEPPTACYNYVDF